MAMKVKNPYHETPYEAMSDSELGPLSTDASKKDVEARYARLAPQGDRAVLEAFGILRSPGKRIAWDIFCASLDQEQQALGELVKEQPTFRRRAAVGPDLSFGREFLVWSEGPSPSDFACREMTLSLSTIYDDLGSRLSEVSFDV